MRCVGARHELGGAEKSDAGRPADLCPCLSETAIPAEVASPPLLPRVVQWRPAGPTAPPGPQATYMYMYTPARGVA